MGQCQDTGAAHHTMNTLLLLAASGLAGVMAQSDSDYGNYPEDDFQCPDELEGYFPHAYSCDKYWACVEGLAELRTCGNGLAFIDDEREEYKVEQCEELHLVECGARTQLEPAISSTNCPRLWGTFEDPEDCGVFWKCQDGKANRYECPPGLAYSAESHSCLWISEVPECSFKTVPIDETEEFACPLDTPSGAFTKHAHPLDCRQFFLCIGGIPREQGCPLGEVFDEGTGSGVDGKCTSPDQVPECADYYADNPDAVQAAQISARSQQPERVRANRLY